ncbi:MAG: N-acetylglucosamine-6-phosphate deacetylase [Clostridia bacterium]|nr:N-acetylglucosamine-6-phosphate deacetylase [Clostridia bacterium]
MKIINGQVLTQDFVFASLDVAIESDRISGLDMRQAGEGTAQVSGAPFDRPDLSTDIIDATGCLVIPGLVDIHIHACAGHDFCDADAEGLAVMASHLARQGVTSFLGTSMALGEERLARIFQIGQEVILAGLPGGAQMRGIHMEGPFFAVEKKGAQAAEFIIDPDVAMYQRLELAAGQQIRIVDVAPERPGALELTQYAAPHTTVSLAHTTANYQQALAAFATGASHVTHLFNAMPPFSHRDPGVVGAASDAGATVEMICDGVHLHPSVVRSVFKWFGSDKVVLVSDAMRACGLSDGSYDLGGQTVRVEGNRATLADGTIAGSVTDLMQCLRNAVSFGVPAEEAIRAATANPARVARIDDQVGSLEIGKKADLLVVTPELELKAVVIGGQAIMLAD